MFDAYSLLYLSTTSQNNFTFLLKTEFQEIVAEKKMCDTFFLRNFQLVLNEHYFFTPEPSLKLLIFLTKSRLHIHRFITEPEPGLKTEVFMKYGTLRALAFPRGSQICLRQTWTFFPLQTQQSVRTRF